MLCLLLVVSGSSLGIVKGEVQTSTGSHASGQGGSVDGGMIAGAVIGVLLALVGLGSLVVLFTRGMIRCVPPQGLGLQA